MPERDELKHQKKPIQCFEACLERIIEGFARKPAGNESRELLVSLYIVIRFLLIYALRELPVKYRTTCRSIGSESTWQLQQRFRHM